MTELGMSQVDVPTPINCCRNGHVQTPDNIYLHKTSGRYYCRVCRKDRRDRNALPRKRASIWNEATIGLMRSGLALGRSSACIAEDILKGFGIKLTRCAVLGKIHRLGVSNPMPTERRERRAKGHRKPRVAIGDRGWQAKPRMVPVVEPDPVMDDSLIPLEQRKTLVELDLNSCRWPVGDPTTPDFFYCGGQIESRSYCRVHKIRAYTGGARA